MIFAPSIAKVSDGEAALSWSSGLEFSEAQCVEALLGGKEGDFLVRSTGIDSQPYTIFVHIHGVPDNIKHVGVLSADGKVHSGIVKKFDSENKRVVVQWTEDNGCLQSETLKDKDIVEVNPRASIRIERIKILKTNGRLRCEDQEDVGFESIEELIYHYQHSATLSLQIFGEDESVHLSDHCRLWSTLSRDHLASAPVQADLRIPLRMTQKECEAALAADGCETGDFVVRLADAQEKRSYAYCISVLGAVRVLHIGVARQSNNLFVNVKAPSMPFVTLSDLVDYGLTNRLDGLLLRRAFVPSEAELSLFDEDVAVATPAPGAEAELDSPLPWQVPHTPAAPWQVPHTPASPSTRAAPVKFSWSAFVRPNPAQAQIDDIYGEPMSRVF